MQNDEKVSETGIIRCSSQVLARVPNSPYIPKFKFFLILALTTESDAVCILEME